MTPAQRKPIAIVMMLVFITAYVVAAAELAARLPLQSLWAQLLFYPIAGIAWALPLRPLLRWVNSPSNAG